ncbi:MAG: asparagine synthase, partial [Anaerolineae bacterium]|nr:asparagine synthase [Anaerolineae bacterium]
DSTALVGIAAQLNSWEAKQFHTLSLIFDEAKATDERERIHQMLNFLPSKLVIPHFLRADHLFAPSCFAPDWSPHTILGVGDLLPAEANDRLHQLAVQAGCRVIITGEMGDSLNNGVPWLYFDLLRRRRFQEALRRWQIDWSYSRRQAIKFLVTQNLPLFLPWSLLRAGKLLQNRFQPSFIELPEFFRRNWHRRIVDRQRELSQSLIDAWPIKSPAVREMLEMFIPPVSFLGRPFDDAIERRHPFTDRRLLEFSLKLPPEIKWEANRTYGSARYHHRQAMAGYVPDEVRLTNWHIDFTPAITYSMSPPAVVEWFQTRAHGHVFERGYLKPQAFYQSIAETTNVTYYVRAILCLEAWLAAISPGGQMSRLVRAGL